MNHDYTEAAKIFKGFCDPHRLQILEHLARQEQSACMVLEKVDVCQSTLSHHLKILMESGVVKSRREGKRIFYSIDQAGFEELITILKEMMGK